MTSFLLPILAIMLVTSEWSQRTALVTFTLEPRRSRVVLAKLVVAQLLTVLTLVVAFVVGVVCTAICEIVQPELTSWAIGLGDLAGWLVTQTLTMLGGFALATLLLNTPASIVLFVVYRYVLPGIFVAAAALGGTLEQIARWVDFQARPGRHLRVEPLRRRGVGAPGRVRAAVAGRSRSCSGSAASCAPR